jgi:predicted RNA binding protein YcfA (HicA-like mRNA interferase family)
MSPLPVRVLSRDCWQIHGQKGSHMMLIKDGSSATLSVPDHKEIAKGTLRSLIRASGMTVEQFISLGRR